MTITHYYPFNSDDLSVLKGQLKKDSPIGKICWLGVGGKSDWLYQPSGLDDLRQFLQLLDEDSPLIVIGAGSNLIVRDGGVRGVVIRLGKPFSNIQIEDCRIRTGGFTKDALVATKAAEKGIDLTFLRTIPGTLGGAVRMNAGCYGSYLADHFVEATVVMRDGSLKVIEKDTCNFGYRHCDLPPDAIIVEVVLEAPKDSVEALQTKLKKFLERRSESQPTGTKTAGSAFRNPAGYSSTWEDNDNHELKAWKLIDEVGLRGAKYGDAQVSTKHPNFLVNTNKASAYQIEKLGEIVRRKVFDKKNIVLEWEIIRLGEFDGQIVEEFTR